MKFHTNVIIISTVYGDEDLHRRRSKYHFK